MKMMMTLMALGVTFSSLLASMAWGNELSIKVIAWTGPLTESSSLVALMDGEETLFEGRSCGDLIRQASAKNIALDWDALPLTGFPDILEQRAPGYSEAFDCLEKNLTERSRYAKGDFSVERMAWTGSSSEGTPLVKLVNKKYTVTMGRSCSALLPSLLEAEQRGATVNWGTLLLAKSFHPEFELGYDMLMSCQDLVNGVLKSKLESH
jgi:hypothetical protein